MEFGFLVLALVVPLLIIFLCARTVIRPFVPPLPPPPPVASARQAEIRERQDAVYKKLRADGKSIVDRPCIGDERYPKLHLRKLDPANDPDHDDLAAA